VAGRNGGVVSLAVRTGRSAGIWSCRDYRFLGGPIATSFPLFITNVLVHRSVERPYVILVSSTNRSVVVVLRYQQREQRTRFILFAVFGLPVFPKSKHYAPVVYRRVFVSYARVCRRRANVLHVLYIHVYYIRE